jgi:hypothetical protein
LIYQTPSLLYTPELLNLKELGSVILRNGFSSHDEESQGKQILRLWLRMTGKSKFFGCARVTIVGQTARRGI